MLKSTFDPVYVGCVMRPFPPSVYTEVGGQKVGEYGPCVMIFFFHAPVLVACFIVPGHILTSAFAVTPLVLIWRVLALQPKFYETPKTRHACTAELNH